MNKEIDDGGPAYPIGESNSFVHAGMTLRDYFAAKAMQAICESENVMDPTQLKRISNAAYAMADAMLEARKK